MIEAPKVSVPLAESKDEIRATLVDDVTIRISTPSGDADLHVVEAQSFGQLLGSLASCGQVRAVIADQIRRTLR